MDACELQPKIRTNYPARTLWHGQFRRYRQLAGSATSGPTTKAAVQVLGGVASGLGWVGSDLSVEELFWQLVGEIRRLAGITK
jgi:hypothetical protein